MRHLDAAYPTQNDPDKDALTALLNLSVSKPDPFKVAFIQAPPAIQDQYRRLEKDARQTTDKVIGLLTLNIAKIIENHLPAGGAIYPVHTSGDEFRIIAVGLETGQYNAVATHIYDMQRAHLSQLGLTHHMHIKHPEHQWGTGIAFAIMNMEALNPATFYDSCESQIDQQKLALCNSYKTTAAPTHPTIADMRTYIANQRTAIAPALAFNKTINQSAQQDLTPDHAPLFAPPNVRRRIALMKELDAQTNISPFLRRYVFSLAKRTTPVDPATGVYTDRDIENVITIYHRDAQRLHNILDRYDLKPVLLVIHMENLGGLNHALNHAGANNVLHYVAQNIIEKSLQKSDISGGMNAHIVHRGGGEFLVAFSPIKRHAHTHHVSKQDIRPADIVSTIKRHMQCATRALNATPIRSILADEHSERLPAGMRNLTIGDIQSDQPNKPQRGVNISCSAHIIDLHGQTAEELLERATQRHDISIARAPLPPPDIYTIKHE